ncbi:MAG: GTPase ObgE, partial [Firmicutes bacterium]|nr:GTPase ObgE [Bacillota bacterium]
KGTPKFCHGKRGKDLVIKVPRGTIIRDLESQKIIADMFESDFSVCVLPGGKGGKGNARFKTSRRQAPHFSQSGEKTEEKSITLEYKTIADVGLVGFPNVGKSTLLSMLSSARPKIGDYHFTTTFPNLGVVSHYDASFVLADIPGLIEGASGGVGLGHEFLRHVDRTRLLVHVVDIADIDARGGAALDYKTINEELKLYNPNLKKLPQIIALNKTDVPTEEQLKQAVKDFKAKVKGKKVILVSGATGKGLDELKAQIVKALDDLPPLAPLEYEPFVYEQKSKDDFAITRHDDGGFEVSGGLIDELARNVVLDDYDSFNYFQKRLKDTGILKALKKAGMKDGSTIRILDLEFDFVE